MKDLFPIDLKKVQDALLDAAKIGSREVQRGVNYAKVNIERLHLIQKRKDLFSELGRTLYEAHCDGLPTPVAEFLSETEFAELLQEIEEIDAALNRHNQSGDKEE